MVAWRFIFLKGGWCPHNAHFSNIKNHLFFLPFFSNFFYQFFAFPIFSLSLCLCLLSIYCFAFFSPFIFLIFPFLTLFLPFCHIVFFLFFRKDNKIKVRFRIFNFGLKIWQSQVFQNVSWKWSQGKELYERIKISDSFIRINWNNHLKKLCTNTVKCHLIESLFMTLGQFARNLEKLLHWVFLIILLSRFWDFDRVN